MSGPQEERAPVTSLREGDKVGAYLIERRIGGGTFADVWLARHAVLRSRHAIKLLDPQWVAHPMMRERFLSEGRILAQLRHPALVAVTDVLDVPPDRIGLVMEFVEGGTLADRVVRGALPVSLAIALATDVLDGMQYAHDAGVIHRDLKPENILVVDRTDRPHAVVVDFGIAKVVAGAEVDASLSVGTRAQTRMGTPRYMSPEQIESSHAVDARSDVFSIGAILYELLLGRVAFPGETATDVMYHVTRGNMNPAPELPAPLRAVIERALAVSPEARFPTCASFRSALASLEVGVALQPPIVPGVTAVPRTQPGTDPTFASRLDPTLAEPKVPAPSSSNGGKVLLLIGVLALGGVGAMGAALFWLLARTHEPTPLTRAEIVAVEPTPDPGAAPAPPPTAPAAPGKDEPAAAPTGAPTSAHPDVPAPAAAPPSTEPASPTAAPAGSTSTPDRAHAPATPPRSPTASSVPVVAQPKAGPTDAQKIDAAWERSRAAALACTRGAKNAWKVSVAFDVTGDPIRVSAHGGTDDPAMSTCLLGVARKLHAGKLDAATQRVFTLAP